MRREQTVPALLVLAIAGVYLQVAWHEFAIDTAEYVADNPLVRDGLTWDNLRACLNAVHASNWHPLTWASHMLDVELFGLRPGWHHLTSVLLHALNSLLLLWVLTRMTGAPR